MLTLPDSKTLQETLPAGKFHIEKHLPCQDPRQIKNMFEKEVIKCVLNFTEVEMVTYIGHTMSLLHSFLLDLESENVLQDQ